MKSLSPTTGQAARSHPATSPYDWLNSLRLSEDELSNLREHVERTLQLSDGEVAR